MHRDPAQYKWAHVKRHAQNTDLLSNSAEQAKKFFRKGSLMHPNSLFSKHFLSKAQICCTSTHGFTEKYSVEVVYPLRGFLGGWREGTRPWEMPQPLPLPLAAEWQHCVIALYAKHLSSRWINKQNHLFILKYSKSMNLQEILVSLKHSIAVNCQGKTKSPGTIAVSGCYFKRFTQ